MIQWTSWRKRRRTDLAYKGGENRKMEGAGRIGSEEETGKKGLGLEALEPLVPI